MGGSYGRPIAVFWYNMHRMGINISHNGERLIVKPGDTISEYVRDEIIKRKDMLTDFLVTNGASDLLASYIGCPINEEDKDIAIAIAKEQGYQLSVFSLDIGRVWLVGFMRETVYQIESVNDLDEVMEVAHEQYQTIPAQ